MPSFPPADRFGCKICGFTDEENTRECIEAGAEAIGLNFWPKSKRFLDPENANWVKQLPESVCRIGVFVNASLKEIRQIHETGLIHMAQLHGDEDPEFCDAVDALDIPYIKAIAIKDGDSLNQIRRFPTASAILLDAYLPGEYGGGGEPFDWKLAHKAVVENIEIPIVLSGGLNPENAAEAIEKVGPAAIDIASGAEYAPGLKDPVKVSLLTTIIRDANSG